MVITSTHALATVVVDVTGLPVVELVTRFTLVIVTVVVGSDVVAVAGSGVVTMSGSGVVIGWTMTVEV